MTSTIFDLGYQRYTGERLGRAHAVRELVWYSWRAAFGIGRGEQARRLPVIIGALVFVPALVQIGVASQTGMTNFISYANYLEFVTFMLALFAAGQAPELLVTDKQNGTLALYLSRPIRANDYALAKLAALTAAMVTLIFVPQLALFLAKVFLAESPLASFKLYWAELFPIVGGTLLVSLFIAAVALALSSFAMKRAYGSAAVIAFFLLTPALSAVLRAIAFGDVRRYAVLLNPVWLISGFSRWLFEIEASRRSTVGRSDLPGQAYLWVLLAAALCGVVVLLLRYRDERASG